jgi:hypothetical protein
MNRRLFALVALAAVAAAGLSLGCAASRGGGEATEPARDFPSGAAVTVPEGYEAPRDAVGSTGAHLPANGRPTLVFVDAIW